MAGADFGPFFHPGGEKIIFSSNLHDPTSRNFDLYLIDEGFAVGDKRFQEKAKQVFQARRERSSMIVHHFGDVAIEILNLPPHHLTSLKPELRKLRVSFIKLT